MVLQVLYFWQDERPFRLTLREDWHNGSVDNFDGVLSDLGKVAFKSHLVLEFEDVDVVINAVENFIGWNGFDAKRIFSCRATPPSSMKIFSR